MLRCLAAVALGTGLIALALTAEPAGLRHFGGGVGIIPTIHSVTWGTPFRYNTQYPGKWMTGDGLQSAWADDDLIYLPLKDTVSGWQGLDPSGNVEIGKLDTWTTAMTGSKVNTLQIMGGETQYDPSPPNNGSSAGSTNKIAGLMSVGTNLYASYYWGELCAGTSILKSTDHGVTWTPLPSQTAYPIKPPMFPVADSPSFWQIYTWVYYPEKSYPPVNSQNLVDRNNQYVYAGWVDCRTTPPRHVYISRVLITALPNLLASDWQWWQSGDGMLDANWGAYGTAGIVVTLPATSTGAPANYSGPYDIQWLPYYQQYIMLAYTNTGTSANYWRLYIAPHLWGPWTSLQETTWNPQAFYDPSILQKSVVADGGQTFMVISPGDYKTAPPNATAQNTYYCIWLTQGTVQ